MKAMGEDEGRETRFLLTHKRDPRPAFSIMYMVTWPMRCDTEVAGLWPECWVAYTFWNVADSV